MAKNLTNDNQYVSSVGRRKTSIARVRLIAGSKRGYTINERPLQEYFPTEELRSIVERPIAITQNDGAFLISARITGGGIHSQAEALAHGIARALVIHNPDLRASQKSERLLARDPRMKERRKFGLKKARKAPQWSKR
ncbi:MAG: 30S ribosomal protein S9 [Candidatus Vogelbacteria bacterium]|nr:30S ribosomal protein S9 [Candidatus Vogelbacteria bacterium]